MKLHELPTPCYVVDKQKLIHNLEILKKVKDATGCKILLAQKAFSMYTLYPLISKYLDGVTASGFYEAKLGREEMNRENHVYCPAYKESEIDEIVQICDHIVFNSPSQIYKYKDVIAKYDKSMGLRINPEYSTQGDHAIYDPCAKGSRLGTTLQNFDEGILPYIEGLHFHTLCEQNSDDLEATLKVVEEKFGKYMHFMKWINFGGGHHITRENYDIDTLIKCIKHVQETYHVTVYLEPGEAIALNAGSLFTEVLEIVENDDHIAILDTSAACHMPDVIEMPYRPPLKDSGLENEYSYTYTLAGPTCLAGDIIGKYSFQQPLTIGQRIEFLDMAIYTMVKNNTFNGMQLPSICLKDNENYEIIKSFGYEDFKMRL